MQNEEERINCSMFQKQERIIKAVSDRINIAREPREKIKHAEELLKEVNVLLDCPDYKEKNTDCGNCRTVTNMRKQTAELVIKARRLL